MTRNRALRWSALLVTFVIADVTSRGYPDLEGKAALIWLVIVFALACFVARIFVALWGTAEIKPPVRDIASGPVASNPSVNIQQPAPKWLRKG